MKCSFILSMDSIITLLEKLKAYTCMKSSPNNKIYVPAHIKIKTYTLYPAYKIDLPGTELRACKKHKRYVEKATCSTL